MPLCMCMAIVMSCVINVKISVCQSVIKKKKKKKEDPRSLGLSREFTLTLEDIEKTSSVGDQLRDPKLPPYGSLYRSIATDH